MTRSSKIWLSFIFVTLIFIVCGRKTTEIPQEEILAKIGDKVITAADFKRRAEYTIRPRYCNGDNYIHKKIILNSLIAEKLLAKEAGEVNELTQNDQFQNYLRGREEQAMRQWMFYHDFYEQVKPDTAEIKKRYKLAGRKYKIDYVSLKDSTAANLIKHQLEQGIPFDSVFATLDSIPQREVSWDVPENELVYKSLYTEPIQKGQIIGPLKIEKNFYLVMRVAGWSDFRYITDSDVRQRVQDVKERYVMEVAEANFEEFVKKLMRGKKMELNPDVFRKVVNTLGPLYLANEDAKKDAFNKKFWNKEDEKIVLDDLAAGLEPILDEPLLTIDGEVWTVRRFRKEVQIHPLVFRKKRMRKSEFAEQFKFAIADLIRDKYIAQEARERGYDKEPIVRINVDMWKDYLLSLYQRNKILEEKGKLNEFYDNYYKVIESDLNPIIVQLQKKYSDEIFINTDLFESIPLTRIDMFVLQKNVPFPMVVPNFPLLTTHNKLDYGNKLVFTEKGK